MYVYWVLFIIIIFDVADYEQDEIKKLLNDPMFNIWEELDKAIDYVEAECKGIIKLFKMLRRCEKLPRSTIKAITNADLLKLFELKDIRTYVKDFIEKKA